MGMNVTERNRSVEAVDILNDFIGDCIPSLNVFSDYSKKFKNGEAAQVAIYGLFVRQQPVQPPIQPLIVDVVDGYPKQILQCRGAIPALGHMQLA
jgi:hypothetical protein